MRILVKEYNRATHTKFSTGTAVLNLVLQLYTHMYMIVKNRVVDLERTSRALQLHVTNLCTSVLLHTGSVCSVYAKFCFAVC
jgi:hypothetical protein